MSNTVVEKDTFFSRNGKWLRAFIAGVFITAAPMLAANFGGLGSLTWACQVMGAFAFAVASVYASLTDTVTADVARWVAMVAALGMIVFAGLDFLREMAAA